jgi:gluconate 2-dehydrogenase gamma chain
MNEGPRMNRRELLQQVAWLMGGAVATPAVQDAGVPRFIESMLQDAFSSEEQQSFISGLQDFDAAAQREHGKPFLKLSQPQRVAFAQSVHDGIVAEAQAEQQKRRGLRKLEEKGTVPVGELRSIKKQLTTLLRSHGFAKPAARPFILTMKELTLLGFFTSEVGATQILQYLPVPGSLRSCIPLSEAGNGKTWAVETSYRF